jgi:hypothetical protein
MDRAGILAAANRRLLESYSQRTTQSLRAALPLPIALPWLERLLVENVAKEVRKDCLVIMRAAVIHGSGEPLSPAGLATLLVATKEIDRDFLSRVGGAPLAILIRYEQIEPIRRRRIERLLTATSRVLDVWHGRSDLRAVLRQTHPDAELERLLFDLLNLYAEETKLLGEAVRLPWPLVPLRQRIVKSLYLVMRDVAGRLAKEMSAQVRSKSNRR